MKMRKSLWMLAAILICGAMTMLTSCSDTYENPVKPVNSVVTETDLRQAALGLHLDLSDILMGGNNVRVWDLKEDNSFMAYDLYLDENYEFAVDSVSGKWKPFVNASVEWDIDETIPLNGITVISDEIANIIDDESIAPRYYCFNESDDETGVVDNNSLFFISEETLAELAYNESVSEHPEKYPNEYEYDPNEEDDEIYPDSFLVRTRAAQVGTGPTEQVKTAGQIANEVKLKSETIKTTQDQKNLYDKVISAVSSVTSGQNYFNPNDETFTRQNWRQQQSILLYDAAGDDITVNGKKFTKVQLPWSSEATNNNLPMNFCDDITPENGWDLVMNYCGNTISKNYNFFAVYNKYSGILRFFTYVPSDYNANGANDHAWEVTLNESAANHMAFRYGLPMDKKIVNRNAIGMNGTDYNVLCSPWIAAKSSDNYATPNVGWWAFDVDLSAYRPGFIAGTQRLRLQMRAWEKSSVSLSSTLKANIQQTVPAHAYNLNSLTGWISVVTDGYDAYKKVAGIFSGSWVDALKTGYGLYGKGMSLYNSISDIDHTGKKNVKVLQNIEGTIKTKGLIDGTKSVSNIASPDFPLSKFDTEKTTLGQGVWNLKSSPVVYQFDTEFKFDLRDEAGQPMPMYFHLLGVSSHHYRATACLFDPSTVEVVLNPNVFPKDQIEYMYVESFCGVRKNTKHDSSNDYRKAFGLTVNNKYSVSNIGTIVNDGDIRDNNPAWDFLYDSDDKLDMKYPTIYNDCEVEGDAHYALLGRGDNDFLLEPTLFGYSGAYFTKVNLQPYIPNYEVTVMLTVKLKNIATPFYYTRTYLPEVKWTGFKQGNSIVKHATEWVDNLKKNPLTNKGTAYQEWQLKHMKNVLSTLSPGYEMLNDYTFTPIKDGGDDVRKLIDGNLKTTWAPQIREREHGAYWECIFKASRPVNIKSYTLYSDYDNEPTLWELFGKNAKGGWDHIDVRGGEQPHGELASKTYTVQNPGTYEEFRFKVVNYNGTLNGFKDWLTGYSNRLRIVELVIKE